MNRKTREALGKLLTSIGSWTNARFDQHIRSDYDDETADMIIREIALFAYFPSGSTDHIMPTIRRGREGWAELEKLRVGPSKTINNCALANGHEAGECPMCNGECPDARRFAGGGR